MPAVPILGGAYFARSSIANAQRCVNYYPEKNRKDAPVPFTFYQRPGMRHLGGAANPAPVRGLYRASNGQGYAVIGQSVYAVDAGFNLSLLGNLALNATVPTSMIDNGTTILLVDSTSEGYSIDLGTNDFAPIVDPTGTFVGGTRVDLLDTFMLSNSPGTINFVSTLSNELEFDALYFAGKASYPDPLIALFVNRLQIVLLGALKTEIWYNAGNPNFPFARVPGAYVEHGCVAPFSACQQDIEIYWLGQDLQGQGVVFRLRGYDVSRISNHALEYAIRQIVASGNIISDAIGYTYQQNGHTFYVLSFPSGNQTWAYDAAIGEPEFAWHQRAWTDGDGNLNRDRSNCCANLYGKNVVGDWQNGQLYELDPNYFYDDMDGAGNGNSISYIRGFPHILAGLRQGQLTSADGRRMQFDNVRLDMEVGKTPADKFGQTPQVTLVYSDDKGVTWNQGVVQNGGELGEYLTQIQWPRTGTARDRVFEVRHSIAGPAAFNGAWIEATVNDS